MVKVSELLINIVIMNGLKLLTSLTQNGNEAEIFPCKHGNTWLRTLPVER